MFLHSGRVVAVTFALAAFCVAAMAGLMVGNPPAMVLWRAIMALGVCWLIGAVIGGFAQHLVAVEIEAHRLRHPVKDVVLPDEDDEESDASKEADLDAEILVV